MNAIQFRTARADDLDALVPLYLRAYREHPEYGDTRPDKARRYLQWLWRHHTLFLIAEDAQQRPVGFVVMHANWQDTTGQPVGEIHELVVAPEHWGQGVGSRLLQAALAHARDAGRTRAGLWVGERNLRAQRFYQRHGFRPVRWGYWVRMERPLFASDASSGT
ncbi:MAG: GNAT family N-acetyltransferase [Chloroflexi bacterium]|nr:GNAT family N-acetyltransferase [Chloroflexota bacterium]